MNPLDQYLRQDDAKSPAEIARLANTTQASVSRLRYGSQGITLAMAEKIAEATDGDVPISSWPIFRKIADAVTQSQSSRQDCAPEDAA